VTDNGAPRRDHPVTSRDRAAGLHLGGRAGNKQEADRQNERSVTTNAKRVSGGATYRVSSQHSRSTKLAFSIVRASILDRPSSHSETIERRFTRRDLSLLVFQPECTRLLTFLPERLSPFALLAPNESIWPFTGMAARAAVRASGQPCWHESFSCAPPPAGPAAATAGIGDWANWGECHLRFERVAA
jgi:hypothetical protein